MNDLPHPDEETPVAKQRVQLAQSNGVSQPREGTKTRRVWEIADQVSSETQRPALRNEVLEQGEAEGLSKGTIATQYGRWCTFHGVTRDQLKAARDAMKPSEETEAEEEAAEA